MKYIENTVLALKEIEEYKAAQDLLKVIEKKATTIEQLDFVAKLQHQVKDYASSIENLKKCLPISTSNHETYAIRANLAKTYNHLNEPYKSIGYSEANLSVEPNDYDAKMEIAFSHYLSGNHKESRHIMGELLADTNTPEEIRNRCLYNKGSWDLEDGNFEKGIYYHAVHSHKKGIIPIERLLMIPEWEWDDYKIVPDRTILILSEGGIGDHFISIRFWQYIKDLGMNPIFVSTYEQVKDVFNRNGYKTIMRSEIRDIDVDDLVQIQAFYLPHALKLKRDQLFKASYIKPSQRYIDKWKKILPEGRKIACKWYGNNLYDQDLHRSIPLENMLKLKVGDAKLISLQLEGADLPFYDFSSDINTIEDTLAILSLVDLTISSCTSVVHMAGSMGLKCIVCPPIASYFTWLGRDDGKSDWYGDNITVIRQKKWKDWDSVFVKVQEKLDAYTITHNKFQNK